MSDINNNNVQSSHKIKEKLKLLFSIDKRNKHLNNKRFIGRSCFEWNEAERNGTEVRCEWTGPLFSIVRSRSVHR